MSSLTKTMVEQERCEHKRWAIQPNDPIGCGWCFDCEKHVRWDTLFNGLRRRMEAAIKEAKEILS